MTTTTAAPIVLKRRSHAEQIADKCVHFNGLMNKACEAGVVYDTVKVSHDPIPYRREESPVVYRQIASRPCHVSMNLVGATCALRCAPSPEYVAERVASAQRETTDVMEAMRRIQEQTKGERGVGGSVECPRCLQPLHFSVASSNGHTHARCSTQGCIAWME